MKFKVFSLRFSEDEGGFDDSVVEQFLEGKELLAVADHFCLVEQVPWLTLLLSYRDLEADERRRTFKRQAPDPRNDLDASEKLVYDAVRSWRAGRANRDGVPAYVVASNRQVARMVRLRATSKAALLKVEGFGEEKAAMYGEELLAVLAAAFPGAALDPAPGPSTPPATQPPASGEST